MKKLLLVLAILFLATALVAQPAHAQGQGMFGSFRQRVKQSFDRLYLRLPGAKDGKTVLQHATVAMENVKTVKMDMKVDGEVLGTDGQKMFNGMMTLTGPMKVENAYDPETTQQDLNMMGEFTMQGTTMRANVDMKVDGKVSYFKFNELPAFPMFDLTKLQGQWLRVEQTNPDDTTEETAMTAEQMSQLRQAGLELLDASTISSARKENWSGHSVFVIDVTIPDAALETYMQKVSAAQSDTAMTAEQTAQQSEQMKAFLAATDELKATFYVDRGSMYVRHMNLPLKVNVKQLMASQAGNDSETAMSPTASLGEVQTFQGAFALTMDNFNQPVTFQAPTEYRDFQEVMSESFGGMMGTTGRGRAPSMMTDEEDGDEMMPRGTRPSKLPDLSEEEKAMLEEYGVEIEDL